MYRVARFFIPVGIFFIAIGMAVLLLPWLVNFRLPGDIIIRCNNSIFYIPIVTSIVLSVMLTIVLNILTRT